MPGVHIIFHSCVNEKIQMSELLSVKESNYLKPTIATNHVSLYCYLHSSTWTCGTGLTVHY